MIDLTSKPIPRGFMMFAISCLGWPVALLANSAAAQFPSNGVNLMGQILPDELAPNQTWGNKCWGYTSPSGREYAVQGTLRGTAFVEVTDPGRPQIVGVIDGPVSGWRAMKTYQSYAYVVSEGGSGIQVIDLAQIDSGVVTLVNTVTVGGPMNTHNLALDETSGFLYRIIFFNNSSMLFYDLADPLNPQFVGSWGQEQVHDAQIVTYTTGPFAGRQIAFSCTNSPVNGLSLIDVTDKSNPTRISAVSYPGAALSHQVWLSEDRKWAFLNDENVAFQGLTSTIFVFDVADIDNPTYVTSFTNGNTAITHDCFVKGNRLFCANYRSGLRVFDITDPLAAFEVAWFDTWPCDDSVSYGSLIGNYPFFQSGVVIGDDQQEGLLIWTLGDPLLRFTFPAGIPERLDPGGDSIRVQILESTPGDLMAGTATLHYDVGVGERTVALVPIGGGLFDATMPSLPCGALIRIYVSARSTNGFTWANPPAAASRNERYESTIAAAEIVRFVDDFETDKGWTTSFKNPISGFWERADPNGTPHAPEDDHTPGGGAVCWVTENGPAGSCREFGTDVSGGPYTLTSPVLDIAGAADPFVRYARWFDNNATQFRNDVLRVEITADGSNWVNAETIGPNPPDTNGGWVVHQFRVLDFLQPSSTVQVRFVVRDKPNDSGVEAAIDDFEVFDAICQAPTTYCTAKLNSCGNLPSIGSSGTPSATSSSGFTVHANNTKALKFGLLIYTDSGPGNSPFSGGVLCINTALLRRSIAVIDTTGTPGQCDGTLSIDMNAFAVGALGGNPHASLTIAGTQVNCQFWGRDSFANGALLSDALEYFVGS